jgi:hypothetical protein
VASLAPCLSPDASQGDRRKALLILANLCIPVDCKAVLLLPRPSDDLFPPLLNLIRKRHSDCYLSAAVLFNLSHLDDGKTRLMLYGTPPDKVLDTYEHHSPENNPYSVLRTLESLLIDYVPVVVSNGPVHSVQAEAARWVFGVFRNLATLPENATTLSQTKIPFLALQCLLATSKPLDQWTKDSLEDACGMLLLHLARHDECISALSEQLDAASLHAFQQKLAGLGGIHELRAQTLCKRLVFEEKKDDAK